MTTTTALYRLYDKDGRLLYVGISGNLPSRISAHEGDKPWWSDVASITVQHLPSRDEALAEEVEAIKTEAPLHNVVHSPNPPARRLGSARIEKTLAKIRTRDAEAADAKIQAVMAIATEAAGEEMTQEQIQAVMDTLERQQWISVVISEMRQHTGQTISREHAAAIIDRMKREIAESVQRVIDAFDTNALEIDQAFDIYRAARRWVDLHAS